MIVAFFLVAVLVWLLVGVGWSISSASAEEHSTTTTEAPSSTTSEPPSTTTTEAPSTTSTSEPPTTTTTEAPPVTEATPDEEGPFVLGMLTSLTAGVLVGSFLVRGR